MKRVEINGSLIARNALLNLIGQAVPLLVGVVTIPFVVRGLGTDRFGLLSLAWVVLGYFTIFDLGLGRATTKYVAEALGRGEDDQVPRIVWTSVTVQVVIGAVGALALMGITDLLVERILNIPPELVGEARDTFHILALSIPVALVSGSFRGVLEASQRFDLLNAIKIPTSSMTFLLPLLGVYLGLSLPGIVTLILVASMTTLMVYVALDVRIFPELRRYSSSFALFSSLFAFGGWVTVSGVIGPILVYLDRFLIGSMLTMSAVAYYTAPYEAVTRMWVIPSSMTMALFPAFSTLEGIKERTKLGMLFARSIKYVLLILGPMIVLIALFARNILQIWLGSDFAMESTLAMQILAIGVLVNSLAHTPFALLQGTGRPDIPAKFHMIELPIYLCVAWILVGSFGIAGAAAAWTLRIGLDALLLFWAAFKAFGFSIRLMSANGTVIAGASLAALTVLGFMLKAATDTLPLHTQITLTGGLILMFAWAAWKRVLDAPDRSAILAIARLKKGAEAL
ncbi:MAG TPA: flippase [Methanothrix sp.]|nr:flippase [Methanothrix sp.]HOK59114.1 flippase [Methanothrix sp.]HOL44553.1 flippase [Methanothrix sp.]HPO89364.1 flippase [Methanothrix sp.]